MFWFGLIVVCILMLVLFFGVTIAGGRAHDRENLERAQRAARTASGGPANNDNDGRAATAAPAAPAANDREGQRCTPVDPDRSRPT